MMEKVRILSDTFMDNLLEGHLKDVLKTVKADMDLDLQIRSNYINIYYKGNSLLKLSESSPTLYRVSIHDKFTAGNTIPDLLDRDSTEYFIEQIPHLKTNIINHGRSSLEIEYEQLIIRANNEERRNNSEYFIIDRQYSDPRGRFDLVGIFWRRRGRKKGDVVPLCLMEVKFALNTEIARLHEQLGRYYQVMKQDFSAMAAEFEGIYKQKLDLGLFNQPQDRTAAMKTLTINPDLESAQFVIFLVDYNPHSSLFERAELDQLEFADQIKIFRGGFAMWEKALEGVVKA